jgi:hypothetical protein
MTPSQLLRGQTGALARVARRNAGAFNAYKTVHLVHELARAPLARAAHARSQFNVGGILDEPAQDQDFTERVRLIDGSIKKLLDEVNANLSARTGPDPDLAKMLDCQSAVLNLFVRWKTWLSKDVPTTEADLGGYLREEAGLERDYGDARATFIQLGGVTTTMPPPASGSAQTEIPSPLLGQLGSIAQGILSPSTLLWAIGIGVAGLVTYGVIVTPRSSRKR